MLNLKYIFPSKYLCKDAKVFHYAVALCILIACQNQKSSSNTVKYPYIITKNHLEAVYEEARWAYYRHYANDSPTLIKTSINHEWDTTGLPKKIDLITCEIDTNIFIAKLNKDTFEMGFCFVYKVHSFCSDPVFPKYCSHEEEYRPIVFYYTSHRCLGIGLNDKVRDETAIERQTKDSVFKARLVLLQNELPLWLKQEAIRRGIIKK